MACTQGEAYLPQIPDYEVWVPFPQWISLEKIRKRIKGKGDCFYTAAADLISDVHQMHQNAEVGSRSAVMLNIHTCACLIDPRWTCRATTLQAMARSAIQVVGGKF